MIAATRYFSKPSSKLPYGITTCAKALFICVRPEQSSSPPTAHYEWMYHTCGPVVCGVAGASLLNKMIQATNIVATTNT